MNISEMCSKYFDWNQAPCWQKITYFTVVIPVVVGIVYGMATLADRVSLWYDDPKTQAVVAPFFDTPEKKNPTYDQLMEVYNEEYRHQLNKENLQAYESSSNRKRHAKSACIYYNQVQLNEKQALDIAFKREPTNIAMGKDQYNADKLEELYGYRKSAYNEEGSTLGNAPNTIAIYSQAFVWDKAKNKKEVAILSVPAPALDSINQPHYKYYVQNGKLNKARYRQEMVFLFKSIEQAALDHKQIKRVVLSKFGQGAFLEALDDESRKIANDEYKLQMNQFVQRMKDSKIEVVLSVYHNGEDKWLDNVVVGDIAETCAPGDLVVNAWDPHSFPGNGNDADRSFDGALGRSSTIIFSQTPHLNPLLKKEESLRAV